MLSVYELNLLMLNSYSRLLCVRFDSCLFLTGLVDKAEGLPPADGGADDLHGG